MSRLKFIEKELESRAASHRLRTIRPIRPVSDVEVEIDGRRLINFSSNDYLGLSRHPLLQQRASEFTKRYGSGATASRLICANYEYVEEVERKMAILKGTESALLLSTGFQANLSVLPALTDRHSLILSDRLNHRSLVEGARLSRCSVSHFQHNDMDHLKLLLEQNKAKNYHRTLIVTESVFSVDGDQSDIDTLTALAAEYQALLIIDEAHATGVLGKNGMGLACGKDVDLTIGTFGKALGSFGAYAACSNNMREYLINCCAGFIYTTGLPPSVVGAIDASLELVPSMEDQRYDLQQKAQIVRSALHELGWSTGESTTQIIPVMLGSEPRTLELTKCLEDQGILAVAIRPPTVERGKSRIRLALSASHTHEHIEKLLDAFKKWHREHD